MPSVWPAKVCRRSTMNQPDGGGDDRDRGPGAERVDHEVELEQLREVARQVPGERRGAVSEQHATTEP